MAKSLFDASKIKIVRARGFIRELEQYQESYARMEWEGKIEYVNGEPVFYTKPPTASYLPGAIIGDCIHNMRTALDLMASDLARLRNQSPKDVYFPFAGTEDELEIAIDRKRFSKAGVDAVELLRFFKPYKGGNADLRAIHDLDIADKHTALIPAGANLQVRVYGTAENPQVATRNLRLVFPEGEQFGGEPILPTLERLVGVVEGVLDGFARMVELREAGELETDVPAG